MSCTNVDQKLREYSITYSASNNIFYHSGLKPNSIEMCMKLAQQKLITIGKPWSVAHFRPYLEARNTWMETMLCSPGTTCKEQIELLLEQQNLTRAFKAINEPYDEFKGMSASDKHLAEGIHMWNISRTEMTKKTVKAFIREETREREAKRRQGVFVFDDIHVEPGMEGEEVTQFLKDVTRGVEVSNMPDQFIAPVLYKSIPIINWIDNDDNLICKAREEAKFEKIEGISHPFMYLGVAGSGFGAHFEDMHTMSFNASLWGKGKLWFSIDMSCTKKLELLLSCLETTATENRAACSAHPFREKVYNFTEKFLLDNKIAYSKHIQLPGDFIITFPYGLHYGYNLGFNLNIASNHVYQHCLPYVHMSVASWPCSDAFHELSKHLLHSQGIISIDDSRDWYETSCNVKVCPDTVVMIKCDRAYCLGMVHAVSHNAHIFNDAEGKDFIVSSSNEAYAENALLAASGKRQTIKWHGTSVQVVSCLRNQDFEECILSVACSHHKGELHDYRRSEVMLINENVHPTRGGQKQAAGKALFQSKVEFRLVDFQIEVEKNFYKTVSWNLPYNRKLLKLREFREAFWNAIDERCGGQAKTGVLSNWAYNNLAKCEIRCNFDKDDDKDDDDDDEEEEEPPQVPVTRRPKRSRR